MGAQGLAGERQTMRVMGPLDGPMAAGHGPIFWAGAVLAVAALAAVGGSAGTYFVGNLASFLVWSFMALGLCVMWGYAGILSFGQTAFFGIAAYTYAIVATNLGDEAWATWVALAAALTAATAFAGTLGYFMFYGGVADVFVSIITLSTTLVLEAFLAQTAGPEWRIGLARLNGYNGMIGMPLLSIPWPGGDVPLEGRALFFALLAAVVAAYLLLRSLVNSAWGRVLIAMRENSARAEMLGYDVRLHSTLVFMLAGALAGLSGAAYVTWGEYVTPSSMGLGAAALPVIWVAVSGRKDLTATLVGTVLMLWASQQLALVGDQYALILLGVLVILSVSLAPDGLVVGLGRAVGKVGILLAWVRGRGIALPFRIRNRWREDHLGDGRAREALRRLPRHRSCEPHGWGRGGALPHRSERRRQEHAHRPYHGQIAPDRG